ncbi:hypothetical protein Tco_0512243 [Tanacetum coccineum]
MFLNVDQLEKQLDKEEFQEIGSMAALRLLKTQFQQFIDLRFSSDYDARLGVTLLRVMKMIQVDDIAWILFLGQLSSGGNGLEGYIWLAEHWEHLDARISKL